MPKKQQPIKCEKCDVEFSESVLSEDHKNKAFNWEGQILCKDCLVNLGGDPNMVPEWYFEKDPGKSKAHDW